MCCNMCWIGDLPDVQQAHAQPLTLQLLASRGASLEVDMTSQNELVEQRKTSAQAMRG